jgi:hypothetical protein
MNKRIKELAEDAVKAVDDPFPGNPLNDELEKMYIPDCFAEKFAELIVRECVNQALEEKVSEEWIDKEDDIEDQCYLRGINGGIVDAVIRIKQHFGIKE